MAHLKKTTTLYLCALFCILLFSCQDDYSPLLQDDWERVDCGSGYTLAIKNNGTLWAWGRNNHGQLGIGTNRINVDSDRYNENSPKQVGRDRDWSVVCAGIYHSLAIKTDGTLWAWGLNSAGQLGDGTEDVNHNTPIQIGNDNDWIDIQAGTLHSIGLKSDGTLWGWGSNHEGAIGLDESNRGELIPTQIGTDSDWKWISAWGFDNFAIKDDGSLWAWGRNYFGKLGIETNGDIYTPQQIGSDEDWHKVVCGSQHSLGIKTDGTIWACGRNPDGQLGNGENSSFHHPFTQVGNGNDWVAISAGRDHSLAIKEDGTMWAWGENDDGQLGDGSFTSSNHPIQIGEGFRWNNTMHDPLQGYSSAAIREDGTLWTWGDNEYGQLGNGSTTSTNEPSQI